MNNFTQKIQERSHRLRQENKEKIQKLRKYSLYKMNNTVLKRNDQIKKRYLTQREVLDDPSRNLSDNRKVCSYNYICIVRKSEV